MGRGGVDREGTRSVVKAAARKKPISKNLSLPIEQASGRLLRASLAQLWESFGVDRQAGEDFCLAVSEAFSNAVRYGKGRPEDRVEVTVEMSVRECRVVLEYPGEPFVAGPPALPAEYATNGRGRFLMCALSDHVEYRFSGATTCVILLKRWPGSN